MLTQTHTVDRLIVAEFPVIAKRISQNHLQAEVPSVVVPQVREKPATVVATQIRDLVRRDLNIHLQSGIGFVAVGFMLGVLLHRPLIMHSALGYAAGTLTTVLVARLSMFQRANAVGMKPIMDDCNTLRIDR
ncbi:hypothetical protein Poly24_54840 [Rosistilla carotiformis]|uniref:Uncharacterized protein n=1 Tax=Rosistilla carotiformis TaxID=2528017 RepID=A0A518K1Q9_9BACT|nr:hypothetical protein Poly24_54840 [Rosistilla carotiformis]